VPQSAKDSRWQSDSDSLIALVLAPWVNLQLPSQLQYHPQIVNPLITLQHHMPRSNEAIHWQVDAAGKLLMDSIIKYSLIAETCAAHLRSCNSAGLEQLWKQTQRVFQSDPVKYSSVIASSNDTQGRQLFQLKCQGLCFPPESRLPLCPEDYIIMYFAAQASLQSIISQDLPEHPYGSEIEYRANAEVVKTITGQPYINAAVEANVAVHDNPIDLLHETIHCLDKVSGKVVAFTVVDCGTSVINGDYIVLQDGQGRKRQVAVAELHEIRVDSIKPFL